MEYKKISIEFANYLAGFLYAQDKKLHDLFRLEIKRNKEYDEEASDLRAKEKK